MHGLLSQGVNSLYTKVAMSHNVETRNSANNLLKVPKLNLEISKGNIGHRGAVYYNAIPSESRTAKTANCFKSRLNKHLKDKD